MKNILNKKLVERYSRQIVLKDIDRNIDRILFLDVDLFSTSVILIVYQRRKQ